MAVRLTPTQRAFIEAAVEAGGYVGKPEASRLGRRHSWWVVGRPGVHLAAHRAEELFRHDGTGVLAPVRKPGSNNNERTGTGYLYRVTPVGRAAVAKAEASPATAGATIHKPISQDAAREMLAALRIALDHMQASIETCRRAPGDIAMVRAAIAKAEG
jgi:hypothetical protein